MVELIIRDVFDLPATIPPCIVRIQDFDDPQTLRENVRDYVITDTVAAEMERLVDRIVASCVRHEAGQGHYLHGSFGSGKSHFMAILGLILENNAAIWTKDHPAIRAIRDLHGEWLAAHPLLVVPVYMLGQGSLQSACYNAANARLQHLGKPPCEFSDADKVIASFRAEAARYGDVAYQQFQGKTELSRKRFDELAAGDQRDRDSLAQDILAYREPSRTELAQLYPDKFSDGMAALTRHVQAHGLSAVVFLVDELILYLSARPGREYLKEFNDLVALADNSALDRAVPLWVVVAKQRNIMETVPDDASQQHIFEAMDHHKDRFPETTELADTELVPIVQERVLRLRDGMGPRLHAAIQDTMDSLSPEVRVTLLHDQTPDDFGHVYPFHPALIRTLIDVSTRLSRERTSIRLLYEMLIVRHPDLPIGSLVPYASLFDAVFLPTGLPGDSRNPELEAVQQTYYRRLLPLLEEAFPEPEKAQRAQLIVKTVLLCGLSKTMRGEITVERILHLNYQDLRGRTPFGTYQAIAEILATLDNRSELVHFTPNAANPALGVVSITLASGAQLSDVLKRVPVNWRDRLDAFALLMKELLDRPIQNSEVTNYERVWRGSRRRGRVRLANVAELGLNDVAVAEAHTFNLFLDYPFDADVAHSRSDDRRVIARARERYGAQPIGFWLPAEFTPDDLRDLEEYAKLLELESNPNQYLAEYGRTQREDLESKVAGQKRSKAGALRGRLVEVYKGPQASVAFLDPAIAPSLDATTLGDAMDRIADAVCDRLYPHHPRFATEANQRALRRLLEDFMVPAALKGGSVVRNADLDGWVTRLGLPLELAEQGAQNWTLRPQSRYLSKLEELAAGKHVEADKVCQGLVEAFGFGRDLCDSFLLFLIRGQGYRAMKKGQPIADVDYGALSGLVLERGERLAIHEWAQVKDLGQKTWQVSPPAAELTVAAQDQLWRQLNAAARGAGDDLDRIRTRLTGALTKAGAEPAPARLAVLDAALALNALARRADVDPYAGLRDLLTWQPARADVARDKATAQIAARSSTLAALNDLEIGTLSRIDTLAEGGNVEAQAALQSARDFLSASEDKAQLASHVLSWMREANRIIDAALKTRPEELQPPDSAPPGKPRRDGRVLLRVASAHAQVAGQSINLSVQAVEPVLASLLPQIETEVGGAVTEIVIHIEVASSQQSRSVDAADE